MAIKYIEQGEGKDGKFPHPGACRTQLVTGYDVREFKADEYYYGAAKEYQPADKFPTGQNTVAFMSLRSDNKADVIKDALAHGWVELGRWIGAHCAKAGEFGPEYWLVLLAKGAKPGWLKLPEPPVVAAPKKIARGAKMTLRAKLLRKRKGSK